MVTFQSYGITAVLPITMLLVDRGTCCEQLVQASYLTTGNLEFEPVTTVESNVLTITPIGHPKRRGQHGRQ